MAGLYPERIKQLPIFDGRFDAYQLAAKNSDVLFASYPAGTNIAVHTHETDNYGVITRDELMLTLYESNNGSMNKVKKVTRVGVGDWYHVPAFVEHSAIFTVETDEIEFWFYRSGSH